MPDTQPEEKPLGQFDLPEDLVNANLTGRDLRGWGRLEALVLTVAV